MYTAVFKIVCHKSWIYVYCSMQNRMRKCILQYPKSYATRVGFMYPKIVCNNVCCSIQIVCHKSQIHVSKNHMRQCILQYPKSYATRVGFMYTVISKIVCDNVYCSIQNHMPQESDLCIQKSYATMYTAVSKIVCHKSGIPVSKNCMQQCILQYPKSYATSVGFMYPKIVCNNVYCSIQNCMPQESDSCIQKSYATMYTAVSKIVCHKSWIYVYCSIRNCILQYSKFVMNCSVKHIPYCKGSSQKTYCCSFFFMSDSWFLCQVCTW